MDKERIRGRYVDLVWPFDPASPAPPRLRRACKYRAFIPDPVAGFDTRLSGELAGVVSEAEAAVRALNSRAEPALQPLARLLLRSESIASSRVEGLQVDVRALARAEVAAETGRKPGPTAIEVLANMQAMQVAIDEATRARAIRRKHLVDIHRVLMQGSPTPHLVGQVRKEQNWIGGNAYNPCGAAYVPPPHEHVPGLLDDLCGLVNTDHLPPLVQAAVAHAQYETIHPHGDGNGRTGRALIHVVMRRRGLAPDYVPPISVVLANQKDRYLQGLTQFRHGDVDRWIELFATATERSARLAQRYLDRVRALQDRWRGQLREAVAPRSDAAAWAVIDALPGYPVLTVAAAAAATGRSKPAVNQAVQQLAVAKVLVPVTTSERNRAWEGAGMIDLLVDLEAGRR